MVFAEVNHQFSKSKDKNLKDVKDNYRIYFKKKTSLGSMKRIGSKRHKRSMIYGRLRAYKQRSIKESKS